LELVQSLAVSASAMVTSLALGPLTTTVISSIPLAIVEIGPWGTVASHLPHPLIVHAIARALAIATLLAMLVGKSTGEIALASALTVTATAPATAKHEKLLNTSIQPTY
jgi:hypothetical protein